ncbi:MAG TPA: decarboxylase [Deltaproteobacteria bacterium]|nr:decarboxylase [Deltaproteobacteria bacterium]
MVLWDEAERTAAEYGDSFYIYDEERFVGNFKALERAFAEQYEPTHLAYSYKTNYTPDICKMVNQLGGYAEVVSDMEYVLAGKLGVDGKRIIYNGPYKTAPSLRSALFSGSIINIDSLSDLDIVMQIASEHQDRDFTLSVRCNFTLDGKLDSRFGLDVEGKEFKEVIGRLSRGRNTRLVGLHCHYPNRDLTSFATRARKMLDLARAIFTEPPDFLDIGGGFYGEMPDELKSKLSVVPATFADYASLIGGLFRDAYPKPGVRPTLVIEPGTALVANTFSFVAKVVGAKTVRGRRIMTVAGSIFNISPNTRSGNLPVTVLRRKALEDVTASYGPVDIAGYTCIENDYLTKSYGGALDVGDYVKYDNIGSYSIVMKPPFIFPNAPILKKVSNGRDYVLIKEREPYDYIFENFRGLKWT